MSWAAFGGIGTQAVFLDDRTSGQAVVGNVFYKAGSGGSTLKIHKGRHNFVSNNIFIGTTTANWLQMADMQTWLNEMNDPFTKNRVLNTSPDDTGVNIKAPPYSTKYPILAGYYDENNEAVPVPLDTNIFTKNVLYQTTNLVGGSNQYTEDGSNRTYSADPGFVDFDEKNFELLPNSAVYTDIPDFEPIPFSEIGLKTDSYRKVVTDAEPVQWEYWTDVAGTSVADIPVDTQPDGTMPLESLQGPVNWGTNYGARIRGYVTAPATGSYTFYIASDDNAELWLSTDENPANKSKIAEVPGWTTQGNWTKYPSQQSAPRTLTAGKKYYFEVLHKEAAGYDHVAVGWTGPGIGSITVIPGSVLSPYKP